jgi:hypothetical protein
MGTASSSNGVPRRTQTLRDVRLRLPVRVVYGALQCAARTVPLLPKVQGVDTTVPTLGIVAPRTDAIDRANATNFGRSGSVRWTTRVRHGVVEHPLGARAVPAVRQLQVDNDSAAGRRRRAPTRSLWISSSSRGGASPISPPGPERTFRPRCSLLGRRRVGQTPVLRSLGHKSGHQR